MLLFHPALTEVGEQMLGTAKRIHTIPSPVPQLIQRNLLAVIKAHLFHVTVLIIRHSSGLDAAPRGTVA